MAYTPFEASSRARVVSAFRRRVSLEERTIAAAFFPWSARGSADGSFQVDVNFVDDAHAPSAANTPLTRISLALLCMGHPPSFQDNLLSTVRPDLLGTMRAPLR